MASNTTDHTQSIMGAESSSDSDSDFFLDPDYVAASTANGYNTSNDTSHSSSVPNTTMTSEISMLSRPYPPTERHGRVDEHDKPFLEFGELGAKAIASLKEFRLPAEYIPFCESDPTIRVSRKNNRLGRNLQARTSVSRDCQCEYHVTPWANAWNEYMKKGKTSFALSLPGIPNYYRGVWSIIYWDNDATYMLFDDIPWRSYDKKRVSDKYCKNRKIVAHKPAIVLRNHADAQPLLNPRTKGEKDDLEFWQERAFIRVSEPNEHVYKPKPKTPSPENKIYTVDGIPLFDEFRRVWRERQQQQTVPPAPPPPPTAIIVQPQPENQLRRQSVSSEEYPYEL
ncbi:unnamed protein product [Rotaria magnacalcarata]|uniref:Uncharacterized protein n=3 Tax=Rotaria magnacalcarata TaxID=392030 RepID=A0A820BFK0_9BILA|nr:unnamed protein product [Rotaria magnacalcarata]CAF4022217.1 unnamed protein product [Rotaria magnacalcarata]CAF4205379.1 unnamed protein product [Rotaria magnacalcarata]